MKPIDKATFGMVSESSGRNESERIGTVSKLGRHTMGSTLWESFPPRILSG